MKLFKLSLLLTILFALCAAAHAEVVGRVLMTAGDTSVIRNNQELRIAVGSPVEEQDTLKTGPASNMQVRFTDESVVSLRDQSLLKIDEYKFTGKQDGMEKAFFNLVKGGFRTITGLIGKVNKTNYGVKTATATIGIRGTHFALLHCTAGSCGAAAKDGVYGSVSGGIIAAINNTGEYQFGSGDYFYAPSQDTPVKKLIGPPGFFADHLAGQGRVEGRKTAFAGNERSENGGIDSDGRPNKLTPPPPKQAFIVTENLNASGCPSVLPTCVASSLPTSGIVMFSWVSGTGTLSPLGPLASIISGGELIVNFLARTVNTPLASPLIFNIDSISGGVHTFTMNLNASYPSSTQPQITGNFSGTCSGGLACSPGSIPSSPASGPVTGNFTGTTGKGLGITLNTVITSPAPTVTLTNVKYSCTTSPC